jgi:DNA repair exonuclease SbcCD ATPase subunit
MGEFFASIRHDLGEAARLSGETHEMMSAMYARFAQEHGLAPFAPPPFSVLKYVKEIERLERAYNEHFNTLWNMVSKAKFALMKRFFETVASRAKHVYQVANRDADAWLRALMGPLETQVKEHHLQLKRRLDSIRRIHRASDELEERIGELEAAREALERQIRSLEREVGAIGQIADAPEEVPLAANAA